MIQPKSFAFSCHNSSPKLQSVLQPTLKDLAAITITYSSRASFKDRCLVLGNASKPSNTIAFKTSTSPTRTDSSSPICETWFSIGAASCDNVTQSVQRDSYFKVPAVLDILSCWFSVLQRGSSAIYTDNKTVFDSPANENLFSTYSSNKKVLFNQFEDNYDKTIPTIGTNPCGSNAEKVTDCPRAGCFARRSVFWRCA